MSFSSLGLSPLLLNAVEPLGYHTATPVQQAVIPLALNGRDILASAETGTGKTAAFALPLLHQLIASQSAQALSPVARLRVLIMTPTRELAIQIEQNLIQYGQFCDVTSLAIYGGASINPQRKALEQGVDLLVATPGRLFDIIGQHELDLSFVTHLVIDEADRMLDLGFVKDIEKVKRLIAKQHQTMMFSATFSEEVKSLAAKMLIEPEYIHVETQTTAANVAQQVYKVDTRRKAELLSELIGKHNWQQVMVFTSRKETAEHLFRELSLDGIKSAVFHGDKSQGARNRALEEFKAGQLRVLIATDLAARGLDIQALPRVINFELPEECEDYVHRVGRTGRAGLAGEAISLVSPQELELLSQIEQLIGQSLAMQVPNGYEEGAPLPARYRDISPDKPKKVFKHRRGKPSQGDVKPSRKGKYAKAKK
ncbi:DEAD/DEAH box helicase [Shewanella inventionis]|uniref:RNA helicase n=1 Tax=Shewanella inventionis TaxID=1738770 RepID=A0ABQ1IP05_9GAMM|nr:DEAD/DEAH box helicase [Shewanella inventionis]MCL1157698.1 DEAD/DEAH box helicase [Shewanella inventionis]GGB48307.1 RNA helicase [Shewanella inventionis]